MDLIDLIQKCNEVSNFLYLLAEKETEIYHLKNIIEGQELELKDLKLELDD
jgi:hypothetical protein